jgi:enoyl-CoA hydratase
VSVRSERAGVVTTVVIDHPEARNAVDRETADELASAFRAFEADDDAAVAVLWGTGGTFCAGADLKQMSNASSRTATARWARRVSSCQSR